MAETLVTYPNPVTGTDGRQYVVRACGAEMDSSRWQGWLEFDPVDGGDTLRSARETTQPNRTDTAYWATGLTDVYLEGSLERTLRPLVVAAPAPPRPAAFDGPAPRHAETLPPAESVLNPFSVYRKGEALLRRQLGSLASWHLVNIIRSHELSNQSVADLERSTAAELIELIVSAVKSVPDDLSVKRI